MVFSLNWAIDKVKRRVYFLRLVLHTALQCLIKTAQNITGTHQQWYWWSEMSAQDIKRQHPPQPQSIQPCYHLAKDIEVSAALTPDYRAASLPRSHSTPQFIIKITFSQIDVAQRTKIQLFLNPCKLKMTINVTCNLVKWEKKGCGMKYPSLE